MEIIWQVDDGYVGPARPHTTVIDDEELAEVPEEEREQYIADYIQEDYEQRISWYEVSRK